MTRTETNAVFSARAARSAETAGHRKRPLRGLQFSLRTLLLMPLSVAGLWPIYVRPFGVQREVADYLREQGATVGLEAGGPRWMHADGALRASTAGNVCL